MRHYCRRLVHCPSLIRVPRRLLLLTLVCLTHGCGMPAYHIVRPGETLYSISWRYDQDYHAVASWNDLSSPYTLRSGQVITLMAPTGRQSKKLGTGRVAGRNKLERSAAGLAATGPVGTSAGVPAVRDRQVSIPQSNVYSNASPGWQWPVTGKIVTRFKANAKGVSGRGLDISGTIGSPVRSAANGRVVYSGTGLPGYGKLLIVKHNETFLSAYAYNRTLLVREGDAVRRGQLIAEMGLKNGQKATPLLHFEIRKKGKPVDPERVLPKR